MPYFYPTALQIATFTLKRKTETWFWITNVQGAPDATPTVPINLSSTQGRNASGGTQCTLSATAYNYATQVSLGSCTATFTAAGTIQVVVPATYVTAGATYGTGPGVYVEVLLSDASDSSPAPQACYPALGLENGT